MALPSELLDSFSDTLLCDERILGPREKELLLGLLQRANARDNAAAESIARTVGEIVAQRAYEVLGESITRRLIVKAGTSSAGSTDLRVQSVRLGPSPPSPGPRPPGPHAASVRLGPSPPSPGPRPPGPGVSTYLGPSPPSPGPRPPGPGVSTQADSGIAVMEAPAVCPAQCVILDEFLAPAEVSALLQFVLEQESAFQVSEVVSPGTPGGKIDYEHRRSLVLMELGPHRNVIVNRLQSCWPRILQKLSHEAFAAGDVEAQITASNDGDFFRCHMDNGQEENAQREITFVYFFHREPKQFRGGELRIYDSRWENGGYTRMENYRAVIPKQNQVVLFPSSLEHEITPVECPSRAFADSRFTVNGWFHR